MTVIKYKDNNGEQVTWTNSTDKDKAKRQWELNKCEDCFQPLRDCVCEVYDYEGKISFTSNQELTQEQLNQLMNLIALQIIEPMDANQNDEDYSTRNIEVTVKEVN